jgi:Kef-type K+ transport system membrane component KefB
MPLAAPAELDRALLDVFLLFVAAKVLGQAFESLRQPAVVGELLAGVLVGPAVLGWVRIGEFHEALAELGVVFLLFLVGLETRFSDLRSVGGTAAAVGVLGVAAPFLLGWGLMLATGHTSVESLFVGTALVATSVGITARVLADLGLLGEPESRVILGAAVIDDILAIVILAIVSGAAAGTVSAPGVIVVVAEAVAFVAFLAVIGTRLMRRYPRWLEAAFPTRHPFSVALMLCLGLSAAAAAAGLAAIIGAFMAGMVLAEARDHYRLEQQMESVNALLVPFFFAVTGARIDLGVFASGSVLGITALLTAAAVVGKLVGGGVGAWRLGPRSALVVGTGMTPRGEVGLIVASLGLAAGTIGREIYAVVVAMSILTTLAAPPALMALLRPRIRARAGAAAPATAGSAEEAGR